MSEPILLVVDRKEGCECYFARVDNEPGPRLMHTVVERLGDSEWIGLEDCPHGSTVRRATAADIPVELIDPANAAEALGLSADMLQNNADWYRNSGSGLDGLMAYSKDCLANAARRAREAEQAKAGGEA